jgi:hypothetical protein
MKKWVVIHPLQTNWGIPDVNHPWGIDPFYQISRLTRAPGYHVTDSNIDMTANVYFLISFDISLINKEIEFVRQVHANGGKVVVAFSQDNRFFTGDHLVSNEGTSYIDLVNEADLTISGVSEDLHVYGRAQHKVIPGGQFLEHLNFSNPVETRNIDLLLSGNLSETGFAFALEIMLAIKEKFPLHRIVYCLRGGFPVYENILHKRGIECTTPPLIESLKKARIYIDHQIRPRPGRVLDESWYCRVPFIAHEDTYLSRLFPDFTYSKMSIDKIVELYENLVNVINSEPAKEFMFDKANRLAEYDYWENVKKRIEDKLYGEN